MQKNFFNEPSKEKGLTLVETIVGAALFLIISVAVWQGFAATLNGMSVLRTKNSVVALASELFEVTRNMPYEDIGIIDGLPSGEIPKTQNIEKDGRQFLITASVINIDDPFDGEIGGSPNDLAPADNKLVEYVIDCVSCSDIEPFVVTGRVAPRNLETEGDQGALFVQAVDAEGVPVQGADVEILNEVEDPFFLVQETTDNDGFFKLVGAPPGSEAYQVEVSKSGYTSDKTYQVGEVANPVPNKPHANVSTGLVTQITFAIDKVSEINFITRRPNCALVSGVDFDFYGEKTIGENVLKYEKSLTTDGSGNAFLDDVEWDTYRIDFTDPTFFLAGSNPTLPISINPDGQYNLDLIVEADDPNALLMRVFDGGGLPIADAQVDLTLGGIVESKLTGQGALSQTNWNLGSGQEAIGSFERYFSQNGNIDATSDEGELKLTKVGENYLTNGSLISSTFDTGSVTNFHTLDWKPQSQLPQIGENPVKFQIATNLELNEETVWEFVGPDGTSGTYYTNSGETIGSLHDGDRYLRYKVFLSTEDTDSTPILSDVSFSFATDCAPSGQVYFDGLENDSYEINVSKDGFENFSIGSFDVSSEWQVLDVILNES